MNNWFKDFPFRRFFLCVLGCLFFVKGFSTPTDNIAHNNAVHLSLDSEIIPLEKVYLHFDRDAYFLGDQMWFKVYLVDAEINSPTAGSEVVYVELIDGFNTIVSSRVVHLKNGGGEGEFDLDISFKPGKYTVRAYTNYMRNFDEAFFFTKKINISSYQQFKSLSASGQTQDESSNDSISIPQIVKPDIQFFPEGGAMVLGLSSRIGFKALNQYGKSLDLNGIILDNEDHEIIEFQTSHQGMGSFRLVPYNTEGLKAKVSYGGADFYYELPEVLDKGVVVQAINRGTFFQINLQSSLEQGIDQLLLVGEQGGKEVCKAILKGNKSKGSVKVPFTSLDNGIVKFTIFNNKNLPLCERLVFAETARFRPEVSINLSKTNYEQRELVELELSFNNESQLPANASLTVKDMLSSKITNCDPDILTYLLLSSEIRGEIESPCYYFDKNNLRRKSNLDLLMMTQGWRSYLWNQIDDIESNAKIFSVQKGIDFKGSVRSIYNHDKFVHSDVALTYKNKDIFGHDESKTYGEGRFVFPGYRFKDSISIIIEARTKKLKRKGNTQSTNDFNRDFYIVMDTFLAPAIAFPPSSSNADNDFLSRQLKEFTDATYLDALYADQPDFVQLEDVEIKVARKPYVDPYRRNTMRYTTPRFRVDYNKENVVTLGNDVLWTFLSRSPGITRGVGRGASGSTLGNESYFYRGSEIVFFLDGVRFGSADRLNAVVNASDVSFIDLLSGPQATNYLCQAAVIVYTKSTKDRLASTYTGPKKGLIKFDFPGIYQAKEFYTPRYSNNSNVKTESDYRVTLHWEPTIRLNANGKTKVSFYTADPEAKYHIELEGITLDGYPFKSSSYIEVGN